MVALVVSAFAARASRGGIMSFALYVLGFLIMIAGLAMGAHYLHIAPRWIGVGVTVLVGFGIFTAVSATRHRDPS
jgi:predicted signal transduction protein with EAL and GGDEF domain